MERVAGHTMPALKGELASSFADNVSGPVAPSAAAATVSLRIGV